MLVEKRGKYSYCCYTRCDRCEQEAPDSRQYDDTEWGRTSSTLIAKRSGWTQVVGTDNVARIYCKNCISLTGLNVNSFSERMRLTLANVVSLAETLMAHGEMPESDRQQRDRVLRHANVLLDECEQWNK